MPSGRVGLIIDIAGLLKFSNEVQEEEKGLPCVAEGEGGRQALAA